MATSSGIWLRFGLNGDSPCRQCRVDSGGFTYFRTFHLALSHTFARRGHFPHAMAIYIAVQALFDGIESIPWIWPLLKTAPWLFFLWLLKTFFQGAKNTSERQMHGKVVLVTVRTVICWRWTGLLSDWSNIGRHIRRRGSDSSITGNTRRTGCPPHTARSQRSLHCRLHPGPTR